MGVVKRGEGKAYTVRSRIIGTLDKDEQKRLYKINNTNTELYCMIITFENIILY
jgi:hypothetical protein